MTLSAYQNLPALPPVGDVWQDIRAPVARQWLEGMPPRSLEGRSRCRGGRVGSRFSPAIKPTPPGRNVDISSLIGSSLGKPQRSRVTLIRMSTAVFTSTSKRRCGARDYDRCGQRAAESLNNQNCSITIGYPDRHERRLRDDAAAARAAGRRLSRFDRRRGSRFSDSQRRIPSAVN